MKMSRTRGSFGRNVGRVVYNLSFEERLAKLHAEKVEREKRRAAFAKVDAATSAAERRIENGI